MWFLPSYKKLILFTSFTTFTSLCYSAVTITNITGYSNITGFTGTNSESGKIHIFGGVAGTCTGTDLNQTCNSCTTTTPYTACNEKRVYDNMQITFTFAGTKRGYAKITTDVDTSSSSVDPVGTISVVEAGSSHTITTTWGKICGLIDPTNGTTCDDIAAGTVFKKSFRIGIDVPTSTTDINSTGDGVLNASDEYITISIGAYGKSQVDEVSVCATNGSGTAKQGICNFQVFPGDKKVHLVAVTPPTSDFPTSFETGNNYEKLRVYYASGTAPTSSEFANTSFTPCSFGSSQFNTITTASGHEDLLFSSGTSTATLTNAEIKGLENGKAYYFRTATIDQAGNISSFSPSTGSGDCSCYESTSTTCHFAVPTKVLGLASDEFDCFIASAIYDSPLAPEVKVLREFRNKILKQTWLGRVFVKTYYSTSPPIAHWIRANKFIKENFKYLFWPLVLWAKCCVRFGFFNTQLFIGLIMLLFMFLNRSLTSNKKSKLIWLSLFFIMQSPKTAQSSDLIFGDDEPQEIQKEKTYERNIDAEEPPLEPPYTRRSQDPAGASQISKPISMDEDGTHYYQVDTPPEDSNWYFKFGFYGPFSIVNSSTNKSYTDVYTDKPQAVLLMEYEWKVIKWLGDLGLKLGTGISYADGKGKFVDSIYPDTPDFAPKETYQFLIFPNTAVVTYHLRINDNPWFVPYFQGGGGYYTFWEKRSDNQESKFGGTPVVTVGGGILLSMNALDSDSAITLARDYGITRFWIDLHIDRVQAFNSKKDFSANMFTAGIGMGF